MAVHPVDGADAALSSTKSRSVTCAFPPSLRGGFDRFQGAKLVEIGGFFQDPRDHVASGGGWLSGDDKPYAPFGITRRHHENTAMLLKVHPSNFGSSVPFEVPRTDLASSKGEGLCT